MYVHELIILSSQVFMVTYKHLKQLHMPENIPKQVENVQERLITILVIYRHHKLQSCLFRNRNLYVIRFTSRTKIIIWKIED